MTKYSNWLLLCAVVTGGVALMSLGALLAHAILFKGGSTLWTILIFG